MTNYRVMISNGLDKNQLRRLEPASTSMAVLGECAQYATATSMPRSSSSFSNSRAYHYGAVQSAIDLLKELPEESDFHVTSEVAERARDLLGVLSANMEVDAPQIFPQEKDLLVLKWVVGKIERFLSVSPDDFDLMDINQATRLRCTHALADDGSLNLASLFDALAVPFSNKSVNSEVDA